MKVYLIRHGESTANTKQLFCGSSDVELTKKGVRQAKKAATKLGKVDFHKIYSSDLKRAHDTARHISGLDGRIEVLGDLREMDFGIFEGLTHADMKVRHPDEYAKWSSDFLNNVPTDGESMMSMYNRVTSAYERIIEENLDEGHCDRNIMIVSHGGVIRSILASAIGSGPDCYWKFKIENCGINILEYDKKFPFLSLLNG